MDDPEPEDREALQALQEEKLRGLLGSILPQNAFYSRKLPPIPRLPELEGLPLTSKEEISRDQADHPPYGTNLTYPLENYVRLHQTSGTRGRPVRWLDDKESWDWVLGCWKRIYGFVGLRPEDRLGFAFSFGPFLGFWAAFEGAQRLGNFCLAAGGMSSSARLRLILDNRITVVFCTPTYALRLAEAAEAENLDLAKSPVRALIVAGEPGGSIPATRVKIEKAWGARVFDHYGMTEAGSLGIECEKEPGGFHLLETECIAEILDSSTQKRVPAGQEGELVLTTLGRRGSPLIRYRTGDRVVADPKPCACGSVFVRLQGGILGRADDMLIVRGTNVYPSALEAIVRRFPEAAEFRIVVRGPAGSPSVLRLEVEPRPGPIPSGLAESLENAVRDELLLRPEVVLVPAGSLPRAEMKSQRVLREG